MNNNVYQPEIEVGIIACFSALWAFMAACVLSGVVV